MFLGIILTNNVLRQYNYKGYSTNENGTKVHIKYSRGPFLDSQNYVGGNISLKPTCGANSFFLYFKHFEVHKSCKRRVVGFIICNYEKGGKIKGPPLYFQVFRFLKYFILSKNLHILSSLGER